MTKAQSFGIGFVTGGVFALVLTYGLMWLNEKPLQTTPSFLTWSGDPKTICALNGKIWPGRSDQSCHLEDFERPALFECHKAEDGACLGPSDPRYATSPIVVYHADDFNRSSK